MSAMEAMLVGLVANNVPTEAVFVVLYADDESKLVRVPIVAWGQYKDGDYVEVLPLLTPPTEDSALVTPGEWVMTCDGWATCLGLYHAPPADDPGFEIAITVAIRELRKRRDKETGPAPGAVGW